MGFVDFADPNVRAMCYPSDSEEFLEDDMSFLITAKSNHNKRWSLKTLWHDVKHFAGKAVTAVGHAAEK